MPLVYVCYDHNCVCVREGCKPDVSLDEGYLHVRPLGSHDWALDCYMINLAIVLSHLPLVLGTEVGASGDGVYSSKCWKIGALLRRLLVLRWRGGLFSSVYGWIVWMLVVGYVICKGAKGYVIVGWGMWAWLIFEV
jgi:hypothetical protein